MMTCQPLMSASDIRDFCDGKTVVGVYEPLDDHTRFRFNDDTALLVVTAVPGAAHYYAEPASVKEYFSGNRYADAAEGS